MRRQLSPEASWLCEMGADRAHGTDPARRRYLVLLRLLAASGGTLCKQRSPCYAATNNSHTPPTVLLSSGVCCERAKKKERRKKRGSEKTLQKLVLSQRYSCSEFGMFSVWRRCCSRMEPCRCSTTSPGIGGCGHMIDTEVSSLRSALEEQASRVSGAELV